MAELTAPCQRLYLAKGAKEDIYVDTVCLPQHQYDGIRFLYKQFRKGRAGVIMNDPSGYGKRVQTVLFIDAIRPIITLPILVLCTEGMEQLWAQLFQKWTKLGPDVSILTGEAEAPRARCVVAPARRAGALAPRRWALLAVDERAAPRDVLRAAPAADYKIWITSQDMKKNLQTFSLIYKFLYPMKRFIVEDFEATKKTPTIMLTRSVKLDAFMEDIVLRRKDISVSLAKSNETIHPEVITRKNKDSTGKKIKRSKSKQNSQPESVDTCSEPVLCSDHVVQNTSVVKNGKIRNNSIDEFIVNIKTAVQTIMEVDYINNTEVKIDEQDKCDEMETEFNNVDDKVQEHHPVTECDALDDNYKPFNTPSLDSQNITIKYDSDTPDLDDDIGNDNIPTIAEVNKCNVSKNKKTDGGVEMKLKEMEELAMKKFKGSILDTLF